MGYRVRGRGQFTSGSSRSGKAFVYDGRSVKIKEGNFELTWNGPQLIAQVLDGLELAFQSLSVAALEHMRDIVAVDTGALRESCYAEIDTSGDRIRLIIGAGMPYAMYVELGTSSHEAQPYIRPTFDYVISILPDILNSEISRRLSRNGVA